MIRNSGVNSVDGHCLENNKETYCHFYLYARDAGLFILNGELSHARKALTIIQNKIIAVTDTKNHCFIYNVSTKTTVNSLIR